MQRLLAMLCVLLLAGCGWQLRGAPDLARLPPFAITGASTALRYPLIRQLESNGITVDNSAALALRVVAETWDQRTVAVDPQGRVAALELTYRLTWQMERDSRPVTPVRIINLVSNTNQDPLNATAASDEMTLSQSAMRQDAIWQLERQLESLSQHYNLAAPAASAHATAP